MSVRGVVKMSVRSVVKMLAKSGKDVSQVLWSVTGSVSKSCVIGSGLGLVDCCGQ